MNIKTTLQNWLPPALFEAGTQLYYCGRTALSTSYPFKANALFYQKHAGERCFILATGPSIRTQDLSPVYGETNIAVSHFHLHDDIAKINPAYHVLAPQHHPFTFTDSSKYFQDFLSRYAERMPVIFAGLTRYPYHFAALVKHYPEFDLPQLHYLDYRFEYQLNDHNYRSARRWDISGQPFAPRTVLYSAIQLAVYMGFKEIYLLGADHDYLADITRTSNHRFYPEKSGISDVAHLAEFNAEKWYLEYYWRWKQYRLMDHYCRAKGTTIYNATEGGMLDVFERRPLSSLK